LVQSRKSYIFIFKNPFPAARLMIDSLK